MNINEIIEQFNEKHVRLFYRLLGHEKETEIRLIDPHGGRAPKSIFVHSEEEFIQVCKQYNGQYNVYAGISERRPDGTKAADVISVRMIILDIDAVRQDMKQPASGAELEAADRVASQICYDFIQMGFKKPIKAMSGNGFQLYMAVPKVDIADSNREEIQSKIQEFHRWVIGKYSDRINATIDNIGDLPRIIKVIGTKAIKGNETEDRPHRVSSFCDSFSGRDEDAALVKYVMEMKPSPKIVEAIPQKTIPTENVMDIINQDQKLRDVFGGKWKDYGIPSRNEAEFFVALKCLQAGVKSGQDVFNLLMQSGIGKLREKAATGYGESYFARLWERVNQIHQEIAKQRALESYEDSQSQKGKERERPPYFIDGNFVSKLLADDILGEHHIKTTSDNEVTYVYCDGVYRDFGEVLIKEEVAKRLRDFYTAHHSNEVISYIKAVTYFDRNTAANDNNLINLKNGLYDLKTKQLLPHSPEYFFIQQLPVSYDSKIDCKKFKEFLDQVVWKEDVQVIQELIGYCLLKDYPLHKAFMFLGDGSNGKSTLLNLINTFLSPDNVANVALQQFDEDEFAKADLYGKLANIYADIPSGALYYTGTFKMLTGGDFIRANKKFKSPFQFRNYAKLIFSANRLPQSKDDTNAFFRRWVFINFPNIFTDENKDPKMLEKLTAPEELSGLFNWAIEGLERLMNEWRFSRSKSTDEIREEYIRLSSPVDAFLLDCIEEDSSSCIQKDVLYSAFIYYCKEMNLPTMANNSFSRKLKEVNSRIVEERPTIDGKRDRVWMGIRFKGEEVTSDQDVQDVQVFLSLRQTTERVEGKDIKYIKKAVRLKIKKYPDKLDKPDESERKNPSLDEFIPKKSEPLLPADIFMEKYESMKDSEGGACEKDILKGIGGELGPTKAMSILERMVLEGIFYRPSPGKIKKV